MEFDIHSFQEKMKSIYNSLSSFISIMVFIPDRNSGPESIKMNGTVSFVDTGEKRLLLTCSHVYREYLEYKKIYPGAALVIGGNGTPTMDISDCLLVSDGGKDFDVAVLQLSDPEIISKIGKSYFKVESWPPKKPKPGDIALTVGFPGQDRSVSVRGLETMVATLCDPITSVNDRNICLADECQERMVTNTNRDPSDIDFGGMSGSAVYVYNEGSKLPELVGILYESLPGSKSPIFIAHISCLRHDGSIDWNAIPA